MTFAKRAFAAGQIAGLALLLLSLGVALASRSAVAQSLTTLYSFSGGSDGGNPDAGVIFDSKGNLYGTTNGGGANGQGTVFALTPPASGSTWSETVLHSFAGGTDGELPFADLIFDASGNLYGTTPAGGSGCPFPGCGGTVFKLAPPTSGTTWTETLLHSFTGGNDGDSPGRSGLIQDNAGNYYGTTVGGGGSGCSGGGCGTVFKLAPPISGGTWTETVLYSFAGGNDGAQPYGGLIVDAAGNLYGTTWVGGDVNVSCVSPLTGCGTVFKLAPPTNGGGNWTETVLYRFTGGTDGGQPLAGLIFDASGNLYGTTPFGGGSGGICQNGGCGTVFKLVSFDRGLTWTETVLYSFTGGNDGAGPAAGLIADAAGNLYGTTPGGGSGCSGGCGTVFTLAPPTTAGGNWTETVLHSFTGTDGSEPIAGLIADGSGALYGTTFYSGNCGGCGTVFKLTLPAAFAGVPGEPNCVGQSIAFAAQKYGGIAHAAAALGYASVADFQNSVLSFCGG